MGHSMNNGLLTHMRGAVFDAFHVTIAGGGAPTLVDNGRTGLLSVARQSAGLYRFTLVQPIPPKVIAIQPYLSTVNGTTAMNTVRYVEGSYNPAAGTFDVVVTDDEATPIAADPPSGTAIHILAVFQRLTTI